MIPQDATTHTLKKGGNNMKHIAQKTISLLLTVAMLIGLLPYALAAPSQEEPTPLTGDGITLPEDAEGTFLAFAANGSEEDTPLSNWILEEQGRYSFTIVRAGDLSAETTVELRTIDVSATYGEDYRIDDPSYETDAFKTDGTLMEQYSGSEEAKAEAEAVIEELTREAEAAQPEDQQTETVQAKEQTDGTALQDVPEETRTAENRTVDAAAPAAGSDDGKSELAKRKEAQTGLASR